MDDVECVLLMDERVCGKLSEILCASLLRLPYLSQSAVKRRDSSSFVACSGSRIRKE